MGMDSPCDGARGQMVLVRIVTFVAGNEEGLFKDGKSFGSINNVVVGVEANVVSATASAN